MAPRQKAWNTAWRAAAVLAAAGVLLLTAAGALIADGAPEPAADPATADALLEAVQAARKKAGLTPLERHSALQQHVQRAAAAFAREILKNPKDPARPEELESARVQAVLAGVARVATLCGAADSPEALLAAPPDARLTGDATWTHLEVGACRAALANGQKFAVWVGVAARILPDLDEDRLNAGQQEFHMVCSLCRHEFLGRANRRDVKSSGCYDVCCAKCGRVFDSFAPDETGAYHRPDWFMRGFQPDTVLSEPLDAWLFVLTNCRYVTDRQQFGREEVWQLAARSYARRQGDCDCLAILLADWLGARGLDARVVLGTARKTGHAWVALRQEGRDYLLETTGGRGHYKRMPPRADVLPEYMPAEQFSRQGVWYRTSGKWTADYRSAAEWAAGPVSAARGL